MDPSAYTSFGFGGSDSEEPASKKSYGSKKTGKTKRKNPYTSFGFTDEEMEGSEVRKAAEQAAETKKKEDSKNPIQHLWDGITGVGNFIKDAAIDVKDTTVGAVGGVKDVIEGTFAANENSKIAQKELEQSKKNSKRLQDALGKDYDNPDSTRWDSPEIKKIIAEGNDAMKKLRESTKDTKAKNDKEFQESQKVDATKTAFQAGETALNVGTLGIGTGVKQLAKQGVKTATKKIATDLAVKGGKESLEQLAMAGGREALEQGVKTATKSTAKRVAANVGEGAAIGTAYGVTQTGKNDDWENAGTNIALGAAIGGTVPLVGEGIKKGFQAATSKFADTRVSKAITENKTQKAADKATEKFTKEDGTIDINAMMNEAAQTAADKNSRNILTRAKAVIGDNANPLGFARAIDQNAAKRQGIKYEDLPATESLEHNLQLRNRVDGIVSVMAKEKTSTGASFQDLSKKYGGDTPEAKEFANYTAAVYDLDRRAGGREKIVSQADDPSLQKFVDEYEAKNPEARADLETKNAFYQNAAKELHDGGLISTKEYTDIVTSSDVATPFNRIFADKDALTEGPKIGRRAGSIAQQSTIKAIKGGTEPIDASLDVVLQRVKKAVEQRIDNKIANSFRIATENGDIDGARILQEAGVKEAKATARAERMQANKDARILGKKLTISTRQTKKLESEINKLNIEGKNAAIKTAGGPEAPKQPIKTVTVKTVADKIKDNAPKTLDDLKQSYKVKAALLKEYGKGEKGIQQMAADIHNGGWDQLLKLSNGAISKETAQSLASQILKAPTVKQGSITVTEGQIGRTPTTRSVIQSLVNMPSSEVLKIQKKIATREPKLAAKLDTVIEQKALIDAKKNLARDFSDIETSFKIEPTTGKAFINGVDNGQTFRVELPPQIVNSLDKLSKTEVLTILKPLAAINQVFRMAWVGALSPGFAVKSVMWDLVMTANNSPQGFKTLGPKAVKASFKALRESDEFLQKLRKSGASTVGSSQLGINDRVTSESLAATKNIFSRVKFGAKNPQSVIDSLDVFGGKLASLGRTRAARAAFDAAKKKGLSDKKAYDNAAYAYNNVLPDFSTMSPLIRQINAVIPFTNASIAGTRSLAQAFKRQPLRTAAKVTAMGVTPAIAISAYSMGSDSGREFYDDMIAAGNEQTLDNNLIVVLPGAHKDDKTGQWTGIIKMPITPEFRTINSQAWRQVHGGAQGADGVRMASDMFDFITGGVRTLSMPGLDIKSILDGKDPRTGEDLALGSTAELPKSEQQYDSTSGAGKAIAGGVNYINRLAGGDGNAISPIQTDKLIGQFGMTGSAVKSGSPTEALGKSFTNTYTGAYGERASDSFYRAYSPVNAKKTAVSKEVTELVKQGKVNEARRKAEEFNETVAPKFSDFVSKYKNSDAYNEDWDDMMDSLLISTSGSSFKARAKQ